MGPNPSQEAVSNPVQVRPNPTLKKEKPKERASRGKLQAADCKMQGQGKGA
jgi:hypothetical protein